MKILHVIESLDASGCARQLQVVGPRLAGTGLQIDVCCLGRAGPWAGALRQAGVTVHELHWTRTFDPAGLWRLRTLLHRLDPDLIHAWRRPALRAVALAACDRLARVVVSAPLPERGPLPWWDRWLLRRVRCLGVAGASDSAHCAAAGLPAERVEVVPSAVAWSGPDVCLPAPVPDDARRIVCVGDLRPGQGFKDAVWAMDILNYLYPDAHLLIAGTGPQAAELRAFARGLRNSHHVHLLGHVADVAALLRTAEVCWVPSRVNTGRQVALEALAQGCAVIATDVPCLRELIRDGTDGLLVPRGDTVAL